MGHANNKIKAVNSETQSDGAPSRGIHISDIGIGLGTLEGELNRETDSNNLGIPGGVKVRFSDLHLNATSNYK